ncbi:MAG: aminotransferase class III-fold pyridoxal phosphate-dependent enzyme [Vicinamibacterales bacterium]
MNPSSRTSSPGTARREIVLRQYQRHVNTGLARLAKVAGLPVEEHSSGCVVFDHDGEAYLDCGGYSVFLLGHRHPRVIAAVKRQLDRHPLTTRILLNAELAEAAEALAARAPAGLDYVVFTNSGAEAVETGLKLARLAGRHRLIATIGGFHGKTLGALSVTGRPHYREPFEPLLPGVEFVPYGDADAMAAAVTRGGQACAVILEPVQGESGVVIPPAGYLRDVRQICDTHGALLIVDEIQTGLGRLGTWWGCEREQVRPDILLVGKALGGGVMPVGAAVASAAVFTGLNRDPFLHSSTFAGNPLAMVAVSEALAVIAEEGIVDRARRLGEALLAELRRILMTACPSLVVEVRGLGLLIGVEFREEHVAGDFMHELLRRRVILANSLNAFSVARFTPPATMTDAECAQLYGAVEAAALTLHERYAR